MRRQGCTTWMQIHALHQVGHAPHLLLCREKICLLLKGSKLCHPQVLRKWQVVQNDMVRPRAIALLTSAELARMQPSTTKVRMALCIRRTETDVSMDMFVLVQRTQPPRGMSPDDTCLHDHRNWCLHKKRQD